MKKKKWKERVFVELLKKKKKKDIINMKPTAKQNEIECPCLQNRCDV